MLILEALFIILFGIAYFCIAKYIVTRIIPWNLAAVTIITVVVVREYLIIHSAIFLGRRVLLIIFSHCIFALFIILLGFYLKNKWKMVRQLIPAIKVSLIGKLVLVYFAAYLFLAALKLRYRFNPLNIPLKGLLLQQEFWQWMTEIIIAASIPIGVVFIGWWIERGQNKRAQYNQTATLLSEYYDELLELTLKIRENEKVEIHKNKARIKTFLILSRLSEDERSHKRRRKEFEFIGHLLFDDEPNLWLNDQLIYGFDYIVKGKRTVLSYLYDLKLITDLALDISGADFSFTDLSRLALEGANLSGCDLSFSKFEQANLSHARLCNAKLDGCNFVSAVLKDVDFSESVARGSVFSDQILLERFDCAEIQGANFKRANFRQAFFRQVVFEDVNLQETSLTGADLSSADFKNSDLTTTDFHRANLDSVDFSDRDFKDKSFKGISFRGANLQRIDLRNSTLIDIDFTGANLRSADLSYSSLMYSCMKSADFEDADLSHVKLSNSNIKDANFRNTTMRECEFLEVKYKAKDIKIADNWKSIKFLNSHKKKASHRENVT